MVDYSLIEKVYCNSAYVENSPAAIKMLFAGYRVELVTNIEAFETAKTISGVPELIKRDNKYLLMLNEILETIQRGDDMTLDMKFALLKTEGTFAGMYRAREGYFMAYTGDPEKAMVFESLHDLELVKLPQERMKMIYVTK